MLIAHIYPPFLLGPLPKQKSRHVEVAGIASSKLVVSFLVLVVSGGAESVTSDIPDIVTYISNLSCLNRLMNAGDYEEPLRGVDESKEKKRKEKRKSWRQYY